MQIISKGIIFEKNKSLPMTEIKTAPTGKLQTVTGENVSQENTGQVLEIMTADQVADNEVKKFDLALAWIEQRKKEYSVLTIAGVDDKEGYKAVENAWREIRQKRLAVANKHKELKADYLVITRKIDGAKNQFTELLEEIESPLKAKLDEIEKIKEEEKNKAEREIQERLQARVTELLASGMKFDGSFYSIGEAVSMDVVTLKDMSEENYSRLLGIVKEKHQAELDRIQAENEAKAKEAAEIEQKRKDNELAEQKLADEREAIKKERRDGRSEILISKGLAYNKILGCWEYIFEGEKEQFKTADLGELDAPNWAALVEQVVNRVSLVKNRAAEKAEKAEADRLAAEKSLQIQKTFFARTSQLLALGFYENMAGIWYLTNSVTNESFEILGEKITNFSDSDFEGEISLIKVFIAKMVQDKDQAQKEQDAKAEEMRIAQLSEVEQMTEFLEKMKVVYTGFIPNVKHPALIGILNNFKNSFEQADQTLKSI